MLLQVGVAVSQRAWLTQQLQDVPAAELEQLHLSRGDVTLVSETGFMALRTDTPAQLQVTVLVVEL